MTGDYHKPCLRYNYITIHLTVANTPHFNYYYYTMLPTLIFSGCVGGKCCFAARIMLTKASFNFDFVPKESGSLLTCSIKADKCNSVSYISTYIRIHVRITKLVILWTPDPRQKLKTIQTYFDEIAKSNFS